MVFLLYKYYHDCAKHNCKLAGKFAHPLHSSKNGKILIINRFFVLTYIKAEFYTLLRMRIHIPFRVYPEI